MATKQDYHQTVEIARIKRLRALCQELPVSCGDFFQAISQTTSSLTRLAYAYDLRVFFQFLCREQPEFSSIQPQFFSTEQIALITPKHLRSYQDYLTQYVKESDGDENDSIVNNHELGIMRKMCTIRSYFEFLFQEELIPANIATLVPLPKRHQKPIIYLQAAEVERMLETAESGEGLSQRQRNYQKNTKIRDKAILLLFLGTGIRVSELVGIDVEDIDFSINGFVVTRKGGNQTILYFPQLVADAIRAYLDIRKNIEILPGHEQALFLSLQRKRITQRAVENLVKKYAAVAAPLKKRISPHKLRSTFGTSLYQETGDIYLVADVLGHADVNTTKRHYASMTDEHKRLAAKRIVLPGATETENTNKDTSL